MHNIARVQKDQRSDNLLEPLHAHGQRLTRPQRRLEVLFKARHDECEHVSGVIVARAVYGRTVELSDVLKAHVELRARLAPKHALCSNGGGARDRKGLDHNGETLPNAAYTVAKAPRPTSTRSPWRSRTNSRSSYGISVIKEEEEDAAPVIAAADSMALSALGVVAAKTVQTIVRHRNWGVPEHTMTRRFIGHCVRLPSSHTAPPPRPPRAAVFPRADTKLTTSLHDAPGAHLPEALVAAPLRGRLGRL